MGPALAQAIDALPAWVSWGPLLAQALLSALCVLLGASLSYLVAAWPLRNSGEIHWTERARRGYPLRVASALGLLAAPAIFGVLAGRTVGPVSAASSLVVGVAAAGAALVVALVMRHRVERAVRLVAGSACDTARGTLTMLLLMLPHFAVIGAVFATMPPAFGVEAVLVLVVGLALFVAASMGGAVHLLRVVRLVRPAPVRVREMVAALAAELGARPRGIFEARMTTANAFALPVPKLLLVTERLPELLGDPELRAVLAHELGHLAEPARIAALRTAPVAALFLLAASRPLVVGHGIVAAWIGFAVVLLLSLLVRRLGRRMEQRADRIARAYEVDPGAYARALVALYRDNAMPAVMPGRRAIHPHLYDRLVDAGVPLGVPRPRPPSRWLSLAALAVGALGSLGPWAATHFAVSEWALSARGAERVLQLSTALDGGSAWRLSDLALRRFEAGEPAVSAALYLGAAELDPQSAYYPANAALGWVAAGRCDEAARAASLASERYEWLGDDDSSEVERVFVERAVVAADACVSGRAGP